MKQNGRVRILTGGLQGKMITISPDQEMSFGRGVKAGCKLPDNTVSKMHCQIRESGGKYFLEDLGSRNGVLLNKRKVPSAELAHADLIQVGKTEMKFELFEISTNPDSGVPEAPKGDLATPVIEKSMLETRDPDSVDPDQKSSGTAGNGSEQNSEYLKSGPTKGAATAEVVFGRIALLNRMLTEEQLTECLREQKETDSCEPLGELLVRKKYLTEEQRNLLLKIQWTDVGEKEHSFAVKKKEYIFAKLSLKKGYVTEAQVMECLKIQSQCEQEGLPLALDELLEKKGYISKIQMEEILRQQGTEGVGYKIEGYEIIGMIGHGGMGAVYKARQLSMDRIVAVKILSEKYKGREEYVERFLREARSVAQLNHENIISGIDFGTTTEGLRYFVMEYVDGPTVLDVLRERKCLPAEKCLDIVIQVGRALDHAHQRNLIHRDIKPDNIMLAEDQAVKLCDLGLAKRIDSKTNSHVGGRGLGTANYMSPEQIMGNDDIDIRADIYSLGATLYRMTFGRLAFRGSSPAVIMSKHLNEPIEFPRNTMTPLQRELSSVIEIMMSKQPSDRYQSPSELLGALETIQERYMGEDQVESSSEPPGPKRPARSGASSKKAPFKRRRRRRRRH
ncbi:MAG: FHA domain-containing serine/threonine-protein kinase [Planctomycetota bacterium]|nr:FHA domain-containing serine/threonine-protein kinase [Planctomycetota bacterium]